ncbi:hypothetical protein MMC13_007996 [Lambiella insularis]|nr:hypothetical protein [Lambiella insularis]
MGWTPGSRFNITTPPNVDVVYLSVYKNGLVIPNSILWVNGTNLILQTVGYGSLPTGPPESPFPYTRLAISAPANSTSFHLYHQINSSALAEDLFDLDVRGWISTIIMIKPS